ncbi:MAG: NAD(P)/FAD-dependent oxidoreductase, partial [Promethearchaeota archaeon]
MTNYDAIIIGSGIGGTAVGGILASKGLRTLIVEKNNFIGGRCSTYEKEGFKVDVGVHSFGRTSKGPLGEVLRLIGRENAIEWSLARNPGPRWFCKGKIWSFPRELEKLIPADELPGVVKVFNKVMRIRKTDELDNVDVKTWISKFTKNELIHSFINTICGLYFVIPYYEASAGEFIRCLSSLSADISTGYPKGGCVSIPQAYVDGMKKFGGEIKTGKAVKKIEVEDGRVQGVILENDEFISSKIVISNAGIKETINELIGRSYFNKHYLGTIDKLKYSMSALTLKIALKQKITEYKVLNSFSVEDPEEKYKIMLKGKVPDNIDVFAPIPSNYDPSLAPKGKQ